MEKPKIFLIEPRGPYPKKLIYTENEEEARKHAYEIIPKRADSTGKMALLNNDPYLKDDTKFTEIEVTVIEQLNKTIKFEYNDKIHVLYKDIPELL